MDKKTLSYKDYTGSIEVSLEDNCLHGKILFIEDLITYEGSTVEELFLSFREAVDDYISFCEETGKPANKPYSGTFNIRVGQDIHRRAAQEAFEREVSLNDYITKCIKQNLEQDEIVRVEHTPQQSGRPRQNRAAGQ
ncbi:MAG: type II toxin-antitoxin system HicB family antitoxin [Candidatus Electrothrix sp. MAN1_4]|nr:type II toxin-antitoxin system HicB family antitoxin [Candidatus Electrothrix sp. MAN1_4]